MSGRIVDRNVERVVAAQRAYTNALNESLKGTLRDRGLVFNVADTVSFRRVLAGGFYQRWKTQFGNTAWSLLEAEIGSLG